MRFGALIVCFADTDADTANGVRFAYERSVELMEWNSVGEVIVSEVNAIGDIYKTDGYKRAAALAELF